jgi:putative ABC transport system permease protein
LQNKNLGFNKEQLAVIRLNVPREGRLTERLLKGFEMGEQFKVSFAKIPGIQAVCTSSHDFGNGAWVGLGYTDDKKVYRNFSMNVVDEDYIPTMKMELAEGRNFSSSIPADKRRSVLVNEALVKEYGWTSALGKRLPGQNFGDHEIIGVVKDFNFSSLYTKVQPLVMVQNPGIILQGTQNISIDNSPLPKLLVRLKPGEIMQTMDQVKEVWSSLTGGATFNFSFVDQAMQAQYRSEFNLGKIVSIATLLAIIIGSLGLYGLALLSMQSRIKEISIRKVLGATGKSLLFLLSKEYVYLVGICLVLSVPITYYLMQQWLQSFEYRITIGVEVFIWAGGSSLLIALLTIGFQTIKTTLSQPAETLRCD